MTTTVLVESIPNPAFELILGSVMLLLVVGFFFATLPQSAASAKQATPMILLALGAVVIMMLGVKNYSEMGIALNVAAADAGIRGIAAESFLLPSCLPGSPAAEGAYAWSTIDGQSFHGTITKSEEQDGICEYTFDGKGDVA